jgi:AcrR family transcriptional regulator
MSPVSDYKSPMSDKKPFSGTRDRHETEQRLIAAAGRVLARDGFIKLGVNAVAREAGVDKVLIYRYFEGLPGLIQAYARQGDFWPSVDELLGEPAEDFHRRSPADQLARIVENHANGILARPLTLEILAWEMIERNELTAHLEEVREQQGLKLTETFGPSEDADVDVAALSAILIASVNYLAARSRKIRVFNGINLKEDAGWQRLMGTVQQICEKLI